MVWKTSRVTTSKMTERRSGARVRAPGSQTRRPGPASGGSLGRRRRRGCRGPGVMVARAGAEEDQAGDAGRGGDEHRDLAHGVPGADVDQGDVDDVVAAAEGDRLLGNAAETGVAVRAPVATSMNPATTAADQRRRAPSASSGVGRSGRSVKYSGSRRSTSTNTTRRDGLDEHLGQRQVGRAVQQEQHRGAVAGDADQDDRLAAGGGTGR